jgi:hypothetical protein
MSSLSHPRNIGTAILRLDNISFVRDERQILSPADVEGAARPAVGGARRKRIR